MLDLRSTQDYFTRRVVVAATDDTLLTVYKPSDIVTLEAINNCVRGVTPATAVALQCYGKDTAAEAATIRVVGWMGTPGKTVHGPGQILWSGTVTLGAITFSEAILPDGKWGTANAWFQVNAFAATVDLGGAVDLTSGDQSILIVPTLGFTRLSLEIALTTASEMGVLVRNVAFNSGVI